jgi:hypothetical protein
MTAPCLNTLPSLAISHLRLRLRPINRALRAAVGRQGQLAARLLRPDITPLCVTDDQVGILLDDMDAVLAGACCDCASVELNGAEAKEQDALHASADSLGVRLPFEQLIDSLALSPFEQEAVLLCAAAEIDRAYERIYAYILDDLSRRRPCVEMLCTLTAASLEERAARRAAIGRHGKLRRCGVLRAHGEAADDLRQELRLGAGVFEVLTGLAPIVPFRDPDEVPLANPGSVPSITDTVAIERLALGVRGGWITVVGVWGPRHSDCDDVVQFLAGRLSRPLRRLQPAKTEPGLALQRCREAVEAASALGTTLWIRLDVFEEGSVERHQAALAEALAAVPVPIILSGTCPWRPTELLSTSYAELELGSPDFPARERMWHAALPEADADQVRELAARYRMGSQDIRAAASLGRRTARLAGNGHADLLRDHLDSACSTVSRKSTLRFSTIVRPKRGSADLVLPRSLHEQVIEVAHFFRASARVSDAWGFKRHESGSGGMKALFTGDSGTGKTLAAEVIAAELRMPLLKVDLSQIVSKWVGETEKHLESAFREAEDAQAVLFFDEADALFGKRGEVRHGVDRYANLEVSYLLQKLEDCGGLVILASNLNENIDIAFTRRFQVVLHFPRPERAERARIWRMAFPGETPIDRSMDFDTLSKLDLTGAGIVGAAHAAALLAAKEGATEVGELHVIRAIARQFRRESRLVTPADLGRYANLLREPP